MKHDDGAILVSLYITEPEDLPLIKENLKVLGMATLISETPHESVPGAYYVSLMVESPTVLYLLGRYVGCDRKRIHDKDF